MFFEALTKNSDILQTVISQTQRGVSYILVGFELNIPKYFTAFKLSNGILRKFYRPIEKNNIIRKRLAHFLAPIQFIWNRKLLKKLQVDFLTYSPLLLTSSFLAYILNA